MATTLLEEEAAIFGMPRLSQWHGARHMFNRDLWLFINTFAGWFSALGTIAAVIVALYLARKDSRISLKVTVGLRIIIQAGVNARPEYLSLDVANVGRRPAHITNLLMRDGIRFSLLKRWQLLRYTTGEM